MKILLIDIETAPHKVYAWGMFNQDIYADQIQEPGYTLCYAAKWYGKKRMMFSSVHKHGTEEMLTRAHSLIEEADAVVHYNGTKFDIPMLNAEFLQHGFPPPAPHVDIDLLQTARKRFKLPRNSLDFVAGHLGLGGKYKHKGMILWRDCMDGKASAWAEMEKYNKQDVVLLEQVYEVLKGWIPNHPNPALFNDRTDIQCPNCGSTNVQRRGSRVTATMRYPRYQCQDCGKWSSGRQNDLTKEKRDSVLKGVQ